MRAEESPPELRPHEVVWREQAPEGKLDLMTTIDFRMTSNALFSDVVLPAATWYEKYDLSSTDLHPFVHAFNEAIAPPWEAKSDWEAFHRIAKEFSRLAERHLGVQQDLVAAPLLHDTPDEIAQPLGEVRDWRAGECEPVPGRTMPKLIVVERDYPHVAERWAALGPLLETLGSQVKGACLEAARGGRRAARQERRGARRGRRRAALAGARRARVRGDPRAVGHDQRAAGGRGVPVDGGAHGRASWPISLSTREGDRIAFADAQMQPRTVITSPEWSGIEAHGRRYAPFTINTEREKPWHTLSGRQHFYLDHQWMLELGEGLPVFRPPLHHRAIFGEQGNADGSGRAELTLRYLTPHSKWSIHSEYQDNLHMLTLFRGGGMLWVSREDAEALEIRDNDWVEAYNRNGVIACRAAVSHRIPQGDVPDVPRQGPAPERAADRAAGQARRDGQLADADRDEADALHRRLRAAELRVQLLRPDRLPARRGDRAAQAGHEAGVLMKVRAQVGMVMALDKCIGCHTCSVTCKQVWTNRPGAEYMWFNDVETKPGLGYPKRWEDQEKWRGGWELDRKGRLRLKAGGRLKKLAQIFYNPELPEIDDYYEPWTYDYEKLITAPLSEHDPVARARSQITGRADGRDPVGPELGRQPRRHVRADRPGPADGRPAGEGQGDLRAGVHVLPAADLRALPEPLVRRVVPVGRDVQARGGRDRARRPGEVPRLALLRLGLPVQEGVLQPPHRQGREVHALLPADRSRGCRRSARRRASGGSATSGSCSTTPTASRPPPRRPTRSSCSTPSATCSSTPNDDAVLRAGAPRRDPRRLARRGAALAGVRARAPLPGRAAAAPRVPDAADGVVRAAAVADRQHARDRRLRGRTPTTCSARSSDADPGRVPRQPARPPATAR